MIMSKKQAQLNKWIEVLMDCFYGERPVDLFGEDVKIVDHKVEMPSMTHSFLFANGTILKLKHTE